MTEVEFILGDITDLGAKDWTDGTILFANSTCFDDKVSSTGVTCPALRDL